MAVHCVVDFYACSLDQTGALEFRQLTSRTGGLIVLADKFNQSVFRESLRRVFSKSPDVVEGQPTPLQVSACVCECVYMCV